MRSISAVFLRFICDSRSLVASCFRRSYRKLRRPTGRRLRPRRRAVGDDEDSDGRRPRRPVDRGRPAAAGRSCLRRRRGRQAGPLEGCRRTATRGGVRRTTSTDGVGRAAPGGSTRRARRQTATAGGRAEETGSREGCRRETAAGTGAFYDYDDFSSVDINDSCSSCAGALPALSKVMQSEESRRICGFENQIKSCCDCCNVKTAAGTTIQ